MRAVPKPSGTGAMNTGGIVYPRMKDDGTFPCSVARVVEVSPRTVVVRYRKPIFEDLLWWLFRWRNRRAIEAVVREIVEKMDWQFGAEVYRDRK